MQAFLINHSCYVYLGSRNASKCEAALKIILEEHPDKSNLIEVIPIDVGDDQYCKSAAKVLKVL